MEQERLAPHVAILSSPGMGHLIPLVEFGRRLFVDHGLTVTIITFSDLASPSQTSLLSSLPRGLSSLPLPSLPTLPPDTRVETIVRHLIANSTSLITDTLTSLRQSTNLVAFVIDLIGGDALPVAKSLNIPAYMFFTSNLFFLSFIRHAPTLHASTSCQYKELPHPLELPGCVPLRGEDFFDVFQDRESEGYKWALHLSERYKEVDGVLMNSFEALEREPARYVNSKGNGHPPVYLIGPVVRSGSGEGSDPTEYCLKWLDQHPSGSVLYVNFGSGGTLTRDQMNELAMGLEMSGKRFVWVVRTPSNFGGKSGFVWLGGDDENLNFLPEGFLLRTQKGGLVVPKWAPQAEVLSHTAVGGFLTHCGWNSTLESIVNGVPMIAWPLYAEQRMNAVMLVEGVKVALRPEVGANGVVQREEICRVVRELMEENEGKEVSKRVKELQQESITTLREGGSSTTMLAEVASKWKKE